MMDTLTDRSDLPVVCRRLRSKGAGVVYGDAVTWEAGYRPTANFWCLATADAVGPDDGFVHPHACVSPRRCFCGETRHEA
jgi:hypothetical protein